MKTAGRVQLASSRGGGLVGRLPKPPIGRAEARPVRQNSHLITRQTTGFGSGRLARATPAIDTPQATGAQKSILLLPASVR